MKTTKVNYRVCYNCEIHHIKDCCSCKGFGFYQKLSNDEPMPLLPIRAIQLSGDYTELTFLRYPQCGSTKEGFYGDIKK